MKPSKKLETTLASRFVLGPECAFSIVRATAKSAYSIIRETPIDIDQGPYMVLKNASDLIDAAIAEGAVCSDQREGLMESARAAYCRLLMD